MKYRQGYWRLRGMTLLCRRYEMIGDESIWALVGLRRRMREKGLDLDKWANFPKNFEDLFSENARMQKKSEKLHQNVSKLEEKKRTAEQAVEPMLKRIEGTRQRRLAASPWTRSKR